MVRTQIQLTESQAQSLRSLSVEKGVSVAELIRQSVEQYLQKMEKNSSMGLRQRAKEVAGKFRGAHDLALHHDKYWREE
ncbi:MAG: ribbon-helix-helix domain-containing protein [Candidatus Atribacteria bacterium]|nr:ribbon-helix-helix domain-containing protein [Candidatus Atribacteria bacterium]